jgi:hypothetical protein
MVMVALGSLTFEITGAGLAGELETKVHVPVPAPAELPPNGFDVNTPQYFGLAGEIVGCATAPPMVTVVLLVAEHPMLLVTV